LESEGYLIRQLWNEATRCAAARDEEDVKLAKKAKKANGPSSDKVNGGPMSREQKHLQRKIIHATMLLANCEHNLKIAKGYIGDYFTPAYVEKTYAEPLALAKRRLNHLHRKFSALKGSSSR
jgi:hypothetical protein